MIPKYMFVQKSLKRARKAVKYTLTKPENAYEAVLIDT